MIPTHFCLVLMVIPFLIICGGALVLALDPVPWPFVADHLGHLPISHVNEAGQAHLTACPDGEGDEPFASIRTPVGLVTRCGAMTCQRRGPLCTTNADAISVPTRAPARRLPPLSTAASAARRRRPQRGAAARTPQTARDDTSRRAAERREPASPPRWGWNRGDRSRSEQGVCR
jgi:hypothetical protein